MADNNVNYLNTALLVLARKLADEIRYLNYPREWSQQPLSSLVPSLVNLLNHHPEKPGDMIQRAYDLTFPELKTGNINQLGQKMPGELSRQYKIFGKTRQYYLDQYLAEQVIRGGEVPRVHDQPLVNELRGLAEDIVRTFAQLRPEQENEHRTLEHVCFALEPVFACVEGCKDIGWSLAEYADHWRTMNADERKSFAEQICSQW